MEKTTRRKRIVRVIKILAIVCAVVLIFCALQTMIVPKFMTTSTGAVYCLYHGRADDTENLFLGSSAMYCSIDSVLLTDEYKLPSYCFGAGGQPIVATEVYLNEFCDRVTPKRVYVEVATIFNGYSDIEEKHIAWSYAPLNASLRKFRSLYKLYDSDFEKAFTGCYLPIFTYHNRWDSINKEDVGYLFMPVLNLLADTSAGQSIGFVKRLNEQVFLSRGHTALPTSDPKPARIEINTDTSGKDQKTVIPEENIEAVKSMIVLCREKGIAIEFMKTPQPNWTKEQSAAVAKLCQELSVPFYDMNYDIEKMGIDPAADFYDEVHLNAFGAEKATRRFAEHILSGIRTEGGDD